MAVGEQNVELVNTKEIELFLPVMREIDFGDAFLLSMLAYSFTRSASALGVYQRCDLHIVPSVDTTAPVSNSL
jgi:hypothetical protein